VGIAIYKKSGLIPCLTLLYLFILTGSAWGRSLSRIAPVNYDGVLREAPPLLWTIFINLSVFFLIWAYAKKKRKNDTKPTVDTHRKSIYFNCSHSIAEIMATGSIILFSIGLCCFLFLSLQGCIYKNIPFKPGTLLEYFAFFGIFTIPLCLLGGLRSIYIFFRFPDGIKTSPADKRHCAQALSFYMFSQLIFYITFFSSRCP
jgi:hypothetical protein